MLTQLLAMKLGIKIMIFVLVLLAAVGMIYLLYRGIRRDRRRFIASKQGSVEVGRKVFDALLQKKFSTADENTHFSVVLIEMSDVKSLEQEHGERQYVNVLVTLRSRFGSIFPRGSKICVYDTDKIAVYFEGQPERKTLEEDCSRCISEGRKPIKLAKKHTITVDLNVGSAYYDPKISADQAHFLRNLEAALINSKRNGPNGYSVFVPTFISPQNDNFAYYNEIKEAIETGDLSLYYQPVYDIGADEIVAYEALLRWDHGKYGIMRPDKFLHVMETTGDIAWVGLWAFDRLLSVIQRYQEVHQKHDMVFSLNLCYRQLVEPKLCDELLRILKKYNLLAEDVCFEIGEGVLIEKSGQAVENLEKLSQCGFKIAIDGFTLEANSVKLLRDHEIDWVKLDKRFVDRAKDGVTDEKLLASLIAYTEENDVRLVALGIEDFSTLDFVKAQAIPFGQGYHFGKPCPPEDYHL